jgi:DHA1 family bicyclomycin/chloramphenicol resistance-like MFS transporter
MPAAALALGAGRSAIQLALTGYLAGIVIGQIATGPLVDRFGRRPVLLAGCVTFVAGSVACMAAPNVIALLGGRLLQALGAAGGLVSGRAIAGDPANVRGSRDVALLAAMAVLSPMLAPVIGSALAQTFGWRGIFALTAVLGALCGAAVVYWVPRGLQDRTIGSSNIREDLLLIVRSSRFVGLLVMGTALTSALYVFLAASPFLLVDVYGVESRNLGIVYSCVACGAGGGALAASVLAVRHPPEAMMTLGTSLACGGACVGLAAALCGIDTVMAFILPISVVAFGGALATPSAMLRALQIANGRSGTAAGLYGAAQMSGAALATLIVALFPTHRLLPPLAMIAALATTASVVRYLMRKMGSSA